MDTIDGEGTMPEPVDTQQGDSGTEPQASRQPQGEMYVFDPQKFDAEAAADLARSEEWYRKNWRGDERVPASLGREKRESAQIRDWSEKYSGRVKRNWGDPPAGAPWHFMLDDIKDPKVTLSGDEVDALIEYPVWHVPRELGERRPLTQEQLTKLATQETMLSSAADFRKGIKDAQLGMGADPQAVEAAAALNRSTAAAHYSQARS